MKIRAALEIFGASSQSPLFSQEIRTRYLGRAAEADRRNSASGATGNISLPHLQAALRLQASVNAKEGLNPNTPLIDNFSAKHIAAAWAEEVPGDNGVQTVFAALDKRFSEDPLGTLNVKAAMSLRKLAELRGGRTSVAAGIFDQLARRGYGQLDTRKLAAYAERVSDQASFDSVCREAGIATTRADHVQMRSFIAHAANVRMGLTAEADPFEVQVIQEQGEEMTGPKASGGDAALSADDMGKQKNAVLAGEVLWRGNDYLHINADARVQFRIAGKTRVASIAYLDEALVKFAQYDPKINTQQEPAVDIAVEEGANIIGEDSQTKDLGPEPSSISQKPAHQPGTSTSVVAGLMCVSEGCNHQMRLAFNHVPKWVAQPILWKKASLNGGEYGRVVAAYTEACTVYGVPSQVKNAAAEVFDCPSCRKASMYVVAGGGETLGSDTQTNEVGWIPENRGPHASDPHDQGGTSFPDKADATEPDHQMDDPSWVNPGPIETSRKGPTASREPIRDISFNAGGKGKAPPVNPTRLAEVIGRSGGSDFHRFAFREVAAPVPTERDDVFRYHFGHVTTQGQPKIADLQAYVESQAPGWKVLSMANAHPGVVEARLSRVAQNILPIAAGDDRSTKRSRIRAALGISDKGNDPAGMGSDYTDTNMGLEAETTAPVPPVDKPAPVAPGMTANRKGEVIAQFKDIVVDRVGNTFEIRAENGMILDIQYTKKGAINSAEKFAQYSDPEDDTIVPDKPYSKEPQPSDYRDDYEKPSSLVIREETVPVVKFRLFDPRSDMTIDMYESAEAAQAGKREWEEILGGRMANYAPRIVALLLQKQGAMATEAQIVRFFQTTPWRSPRQAAFAYAKAKLPRVAAKISEGWGENGVFERAVEADTPADLWKLHNGLNGKPVEWPEPPVPSPVRDVDAQGQPGPGGPAAPPQPGKPGDAPVDPALGVAPGPVPPGATPPADPTVTTDGKEHMPEPEPEPLAGNRMASILSDIGW